LVAFDVQHRRLVFTAVQGEPLGPKYPTELSADSIDAAAELAERLRGFTPERRWLRRYNAERRLALARRVGLLTDTQFSDLVDVAARAGTRLRFSHGDLTARNVLRDSDGLVLIDWEWAGLYPESYDLAFLWFSLIDVDRGRERVEKHLDTRAETPFLLSALLIQLWHLQWYVPVEFRDRHLSTRDGLIERLCG
jgi:thiamine kinase-like enzyme